MLANDLCALRATRTLRFRSCERCHERIRHASEHYVMALAGEVHVPIGCPFIGENLRVKSHALFNDLFDGWTVYALHDPGVELRVSVPFRTLQHAHDWRLVIAL